MPGANGEAQQYSSIVALPASTRGMGSVFTSNPSRARKPVNRRGSRGRSRYCTLGTADEKRRRLIAITHSNPDCPMANSHCCAAHSSDSAQERGCHVPAHTRVHELCVWTINKEHLLLLTTANAPR